jgi:rSAM-associated Gly-rich repeat protein
MKPTTLFGTLVLLSTWSSVGATEAGTYTFEKADNNIEQRIAAARSKDSLFPLLKQTLNGHPDIAAWGNGRGRGWANGGGGGGGFGNARGGGWGNGGGGFANARYRGGFANW